MSRIAIALMYLVHFLPVPLIRTLSAGVGHLLYWIGGSRRRVARTNLTLAFPDLEPQARERLVREVFVRFAQGVFDRAVLWYGSEKRLRDFVQVEGEEHMLPLLGRPLILLAPHFAGMEAGGTRISMDRQVVSLFANQKDPHFDRALRAGRSRFNDTILVSRQDSVRKAVRELAKAIPFFYLPDMDLGPRDAVFVPFFGTPAATVTAVSRLAKLTGAAVVPCVTRMSGNGYVVRLFPAWENFPSESLEEDARRMNAFIEEQVRTMPAQYHWLHRRYKTRPPGEPSLY
ncbi:MAG TPA: lipid A biosynthesis acyltransferase [Burkholderiales bacterium]